MRWENSESRRSPAPKRSPAKRLPVPSRIVVGALAIASIIMAFILRPPQQAQNPQTALPEAKPTYVAAAIVAIPTTQPPGSGAAVASATPSVPASAPASASAARIHDVVQGDTLSSIAKKYYNDASKFNKILDANKDVLKNADSLQLGMKLKIPE